MKNLFLVGMMVFMVNFIWAQQSYIKIDTSFKACKAVKIVNKVLQVNYPDYDTCTHVGFFKAVIIDNKMEVECFFGNKRRNVMPKNYTLTNEEYESWDKSTEGLIYILCRYFDVEVELVE